MTWQILVTIFITSLYAQNVFCEDQLFEMDCSVLRMGQYLCPDPSYLDEMIDPKTEQLRGCTKENKAKVRCIVVEGLICTESGNRTFYKEMPCKWTNGYSFETTLLLSIFLGMFGIDRFYLGYPAIGLAKFCTLGFMFLGQLIDIILISTQVVTPADGSYYVMPYYGPHVEVIKTVFNMFSLAYYPYSEPASINREGPDENNVGTVRLEKERAGSQFS